MTQTGKRIGRLAGCGLALGLGIVSLLPRAVAQDEQMLEARQIGALLLKQADDWNRGDLDAFARGYKDAPDILFMGSTIQKGYAAMVAGYKKRYPTQEKMGKLTFTSLAVQPLDERFATATGQFLLKRTVADGGPAAGYFLLVLEKTASGWKIIRDDTTGTQPKPACQPGVSQ